LLKEIAKTGSVFALVRIYFGIRPLEVHGAEYPRSTVSRTREVDHAKVILLDQPVEVDIDECQSWTGSPVSEQPILDMFRLERLL
jgi:hypothetical protein